MVPLVIVNKVARLVHKVFKIPKREIVEPYAGFLFRGGVLYSVIPGRVRDTNVRLGSNLGWQVLST